MNKELLKHYEFLLHCTESLVQPDKPLQEMLCPMFYHTLTYEGDLELINQTKEARRFLEELKNDIQE